MSIAGVALVQFDAIPAQTDRNHEKMKSLVKESVDSNARCIVFHEAIVCDYTSERDKYAEPIPTVKLTCYMSGLASRHNCSLRTMATVGKRMSRDFCPQAEEPFLPE
jgi:predicted amidohydrolase